MAKVWQSRKALGLRLVHKAYAAQAFEACAGLDPEGGNAHTEAASLGVCFELTGKTGSMVYAARTVGTTLWVQAAVGKGSGISPLGFEVIEHQAKVCGCKNIGFQTLRRGLIRIAKKQGYEVIAPVGVGFVLNKALT